MGTANSATKKHLTAPPSAYASLTAYCPDLDEWPQRWHFDARDLVLGQQIVAVLAPFLLHLLGSGLSQKVLRKHRDNLWLLGGEIVRRVQDEPPLRRKSAATLLDRFIEDEGGPLIYPRISEVEQKSFDSTCRKLFRYRAKPPAAKER